eukprot:s1016_g12.t1
MLLLQLIASCGWSLGSFDIRAAFLQGRTQQGRTMGLEPVPELAEALKVKPDEVCKLDKSAYGLIDAPYLWFQTLCEELIALGMTPSPFDPCLFLLRHPDTGELSGALGVHVDDGIHGGDEYFHQQIQKLEAKYPFGSKKSRSFTFTGIDMQQQPDNSIRLSQSKYVNNIPAISLKPERRCMEDEPVTEEERHLLRGLVGSLQYAAVHTRPDLSSALSHLQSQINQAKVSTLISANKETQLYSQERDAEGIDVNHVDLSPEVGVQTPARASESQRTFSRRSSRYFARSDSYNYSDSYDLRTKVRKRLHKYLFARPGNLSETEIDLVSGTDRQLWAEEVLQEGWDVDELTEVLQEMPVTGREVWLDCLLLALEEQMHEESPIVEVLRPSGLKDASEKMRKGRLKGHTRDTLLKFYERLDKVLQILENKASTHYFQYLERESEQRQDLIEKQNEVLHDYVCELEHEFCELTGAVSSYQTKKDMMLAKLSGVLDPEFAHCHKDGTCVLTGCLLFFLSLAVCSLFGWACGHLTLPYIV